MKLKQALKFIMKDIENPEVQVHISLLEQQILQDVNQVKRKSMKNSSMQVTYWTNMRSHIIKGFPIIIFLVAMAGILGFISIQTSQQKQVALLKIASAEELLEQVGNTFDKRIYYREVTEQPCDPATYDRSFPNEAGVMEHSQYDDILKADCIKNGGKHIRSRRVWIDNATQSIKYEEENDQLNSFTGKDKQGRERMQLISPIIIKKGKDLYRFEGVHVPNSPLKGEGIYIQFKESDKKYTEYVSIHKQLQTFSTFSKEELMKRITDKTYLVPGFPLSEQGKAHTRFELKETQDHYVLQIYYDVSFEIVSQEPKAEVLAQPSMEEFYDKKTFKPIKRVGYSTELDENGNRKVSVTTLYQDVTTDFDSHVFSVEVVPEGYAFSKGTIKKFDIYAQDTVMDRVKIGDPLEFQIKPFSYINEQGKEVEYSSQVGFSHIKTYWPFDFKVYEATQSFSTREEAATAKNLEYRQIKAKNEYLIYESSFKVGQEQRYYQLKVETYDKKTGKKIGETIGVAHSLFLSTKPPDGVNSK